MENGQLRTRKQRHASRAVARCRSGWKFDRRGSTMKTISRRYQHDSDYEKVSQLLLRTYGTSGDHVNWLPPRWEYMHHHPYISRIDLSSIGIWERDGEIVAVVHPELRLGEVYTQVSADDPALKRDLLAYAEERLAACSRGAKALKVHINDHDGEFQHIAAQKGYEKGESYEEMSRFAIPSPFPAITLPDGFQLKSLAESSDLRKVNRLTFRGFNHGDEPPDDSTEARKFMQSAPNYRKDLNIVVEAPDGNFVSYCCMFYEPKHRIASVEITCTDPDYRRRGLATAALLEGIRRCGKQGARIAYVGSAEPFCRSVGFQRMHRISRWQRSWSARPPVKRHRTSVAGPQTASRESFARTRLKRYQRFFGHSYATGAFATLELLAARPKDVLGVILSAKSERNRGVAKLKNLCARMHIPIQVDDRTIERLSSKGNDFAIGVSRKYCSQLAPHRNHVVLVNPRDMGNVGSIARAMVGFGIRDLALIRPAVDIFDPRTVRASMGAVFRLSFQYFDSFEQYHNCYGRNLYPLMTNGRVALGVARFHPRFALIFGNESQGLPDEFLEIGTSVTIPHNGPIDSLNLSTAAAIAIYESTRPQTHREVPRGGDPAGERRHHERNLSTVQP